MHHDVVKLFVMTAASPIGGLVVPRRVVDVRGDVELATETCIK